MNGTMSCSSPNLLRYSFLQEFSKSIFVLICVVDAAIFLSASLGNTLILVSLRKSQAIHSPSKALFSSLALSDLAVGLIVAPLHFGLTLAVVQDNPSLYCLFFAPTTAAGYTMASVSTLTAVAVAVDRYLAFCLRIRYRHLVTVNRVVLYFLALMLLFSVGLDSSTFLVLSLSYVIIILNSSLNPFVYCWRIGEIRKQVLNILNDIFSMCAS